MTYGSWDMEHNREDFLSFWTIFCPLTPLTRKIKILKKWKSPPWDIIILHKCAKNHDHTCYTVLEIWCVADIIFIFHFRLFLPSYPCNNPKEFQNFKKMKKKDQEISSFYTCVPKIVITWCMVPENCCARMDGQMDKVTYRCGCQLKNTRNKWLGDYDCFEYKNLWSWEKNIEY